MALFEQLAGTQFTCFTSTICFTSTNGAGNAQHVRRAKEDAEQVALFSQARMLTDVC
jgi:hypothetical protein